jgi:hypothetical protein
MERLKVHRLLSILTIVVGVAGVIIVGHVEDDPIVIPPLLIVLGIVWFLITHVRIRSHHT